MQTGGSFAALPFPRQGRGDRLPRGWTVLNLRRGGMDADNLGTQGVSLWRLHLIPAPLASGGR